MRRRGAVRALWTPMYLARRPRLLLFGADAQFTAGVLTGWPNRGIDGTVATVGGSPPIATAVNGQQGVQFVTAGQNVAYTMASLTSGRCSIYTVSTINTRAASTGGGLFHASGFSDANSIYFAPWADDVGGQQMWAAGFGGGTNVSGFNGYPGGIPSLDTPVDLITQVGGTDIHYWVDGVDIIGLIVPAGGQVGTGDVTNPTTSTWTVGEGWGGTAEVFKGTINHLMITDYSLSLDERLRWQGWQAWTYARQAKLPVGHPYINGPPTVPIMQDPWALNDNGLLIPSERKLIVPGWREAA